MSSSIVAHLIHSSIPVFKLYAPHPSRVKSHLIFSGLRTFVSVMDIVGVVLSSERKFVFSGMW